MIEKQNDNLIISINLGDLGSTGNIMLNSLEYAHEHGPFDVLALIPYETKQQNKVTTLSFGVKIPKLKRGYYKILRKIKSPIINDGNYYNEYTRKLIGIIKESSKNYKITIIHMHNMHMCSLNVNKFYRWLGKHNEYKVLYTLHDSWIYTGGCYYYSHINCNKWKKDCKECPEKLYYTHLQLKKRTKLLNMINNLTLIPVSHWLNSELKQSKLKTIPSIVNWGETPLLPIDGNNILKEELEIKDKNIVLCVSAYWNEWKGIGYLFQIADRLPNNYAMIIIGKANGADKHKNIINIPYADNLTELPYYYQISDVYISVTQAEALGLTTCEAQICGCPVVMFGQCGSKETIIERKSGIIVDNNIDKMVEAIKYVVNNKPFNKKDIIESGNRFEKYTSAKRQLKIYNNTISF